MKLASSPLAQRLKTHLPPGVRQRLRRLVYGNRHPAFPALKGVAAIQDLYYWVSDDTLDTLIPLENYFSVFFPELDTATTATIEMFDRQGAKLGETTVEVGHMATPLVRTSTLLRTMAPSLSGSADAYGNVIWHLHVPKAVARHIEEMAVPFLFWDRLYIGYAGRNGAACFVHGVDKYDVRGEIMTTTPWSTDATASFTASPEIPIEMNEYESIELVIQNRGPAERTFRLAISDARGGTIERRAEVKPRGVHRFRIVAADVAELDTGAPLSLEMFGLPSRYGRPILFKRFPSGAFSAMHC